MQSKNHLEYGNLIDRPEIFDVKTIKVEGKLNGPKLRFTLDYEKNYESISNICSNVPFEKALNLYNVIDYLDKNPEVAKISQNCVQLDLHEKAKEEIDKNFEHNLKKIKRIKGEVYKEAGKA